MKQHKKTLLLGAHLSVAGGYEQAIIRGAEIGCTAVQIFTKSNRQWAAKEITAPAIELFRQTQNNFPQVKSIIAHASYLINLASLSPQTREKSLKALIDELHRCDQLGIPYLVIHPGSNNSLLPEENVHQIALGINIALENSTNTTILIETMAGQGSSTCSSFDQIASLYNRIIHKERSGVCFDTCHAFAAGYDFRTPTLYNAMWEHFDATVGLKALKALHLNDSKKNLGSKVDRHEDIGKGFLGLEPFKLLLNDPRFFDTPKILETPKDSIDDDIRNLAVLKDLLDEGTKRIFDMGI